ncbi:MAG: DUF58 domain-containing protein [Opitutales bacterium]
MANPFILKATTATKQPPPLPGSEQARGQSRRGRTVQLLNPEELDRYKNLYAFTRSRVEGYLSGRHKSPFKGSSSDFADYREYSQGMDISRIDWRLYGRTRRLYIRRFEEETDMTVYLLIDTSASMRYAGGGRLPKYIQAARLAAAIAYLAARQRDKVALGLVSDTLVEYRKAGNSRLHLQNLFTCLEGIQPSDKTSLPHALRDCAEVMRRRGRLILISDFHDDLDELLQELGQFVHRGFEIQLMHILDHDERKLPPSAAIEFVDMETDERVKADIEDIRTIYSKRIEDVIETLRTQSIRRQMGYHLLDSADSLHDGLEAYFLIGSQQMRKGAG